MRHYVLLYKVRSIGSREQSLSIVSQFLSDRRQCVRFDSEVNVSLDVVSGVPQGRVLVPLLFMFTTIYAVIPRLLLRPQAMDANRQLSTHGV